MKAISLFSGGLDSQLAVYLIKNQGIEVIGLNFVSPFFGANESTYKAAQELGIKLQTIDIGQEYISEVLRKPVYGYGKNLNPCIDCHAYMLKRAGHFMEEYNASFILTGEVLGQRPMSQTRSALSSVDKISGYKGLTLRPLSALLLPETIPESEGWIDRNQLLDISGRGRSRQMELAQEFGIHDYPTPAGGCLLTDENFSRRIKPLLATKDEIDPLEIEVYKVGRHFILNGNLLVVGRNHAENERLQEIAAEADYLLKVIDRPGPLALFRSSSMPSQQEFEYVAAIVARYSDAKNETQATVKAFKTSSNDFQTFIVKPLSPEAVPVTV
ncbi:MAG: tRNA 4-thiouridine(8) synthase ThiI [Syntrophomonadaceae bacterium]|nr:tRNA 4-thiouridine(8) synthase ThiI [Syntrophomonadaceae bacterium]